MTAEQRLFREYLSIIKKEGIYPSLGNLKFNLKTTFESINFENKRVLDIGGGSGILSFYAACMGAKKVVCLEPEADGSKSGIIEKFRKLQASMGFNNVKLEPITFQSFNPADKKYDIILLYKSINHLNEMACINLLKNENSKKIYRDIFSKISFLSNSGAKLIVCDCSRYNFFAFLRIRNPFVPSIEWHKHQSPKVWATLLSEVGFCNPEIRWIAFNTLRTPGKLMLSNKYASYFLNSYFCLKMEKN